MRKRDLQTKKASRLKQAPKQIQTLAVDSGQRSINGNEMDPTKKDKYNLKTFQVDGDYQVKSAEEGSDALFSFTGDASVFNVLDKHNDIIPPGQFTKTIKQKFTDRVENGKAPLIKTLWLHSMPLGIPTEINQNARTLSVSADVMDTALGRDAKALMKGGVVDGISIGFIPKRVEFVKGGDVQAEDVFNDQLFGADATEKEVIGLVENINDVGHAWILKDIDLWEFSPVVWGANQEAFVDSVKNFRAAIAETLGVDQRNSLATGVDPLVSEDRIERVKASLLELGDPGPVAGFLRNLASALEGSHLPEVEKFNFEALVNTTSSILLDD